MMAASESVHEIAGKFQQLTAEEKRQLFALVPSLWECLPVEDLLPQLFLEEEVIRHGYRLNKKKQKRLSQLLEKNRVQTLTPDEEEEMDQLIEQSEELMLLKAQILYALKSLTKRLSGGASGKP